MSVELIFKKYFYLVVLVLVAMAAYFQASGISSLIGAQFSPGSGPTFKPMVEAKTSSAVRLSVQTLQRRNPFDSVTGTVFPGDQPPPEAPVEEQGPRFDDPLTVPVCPGVSVLILTESDDPLWSFAAMMGPGETAPHLRRVGDSIGTKKVAYIGYNPSSAAPTVWLEDDSLCQISLFASEPPPPAEPVAAADAGAEAAVPAEADDGKPGKAGGALDPEIKSKIKKLSETEFEIDRTAVDKILEDQSSLMRSARIVPEQKDGKTVGIRLFGVRPETLLGQLGLKNGDRLESINGFDMGSPEKALEAYARLRTADSLKIKLNRRGQDTTLDFKIK